MLPREGTLEVKRTEHGVLAVLRIQGVELTAGCGYDEAAEMGAAIGLWPEQEPGVGFSFAGIARAIRSAASSVAKLRVVQQLGKLATSLPGPVGDVARLAAKGVKAIQAMAHAAPPVAQAARRLWEQSAQVARRDPSSPVAVAMRLAMDAAGRPRMGAPATAPAAPQEPPPRPPSPPLDGGLREPPPHDAEDPLLEDFAP